MNVETIERIIALFDEFPVTEIELTESGSRVAVTRGTPAVRPPASFAPLTETDPLIVPTSEASLSEPAIGLFVEAQTVGIFRHATPPIRAGVAVEDGQMLGAIESMKLLHDVFSPTRGRIAEVVQEDGRAVEFGSVLFHIIPE